VISAGLRIGRYEIGSRLGKGGFGVVHLARDVDLDREIAIKVLKPEYLTKPSIVQRFLNEARAAAKIGHAGIVTVFECGQIQGTGTFADGNAYIAMELLVGESLADRITNGGRMTLPKAINITRQLAGALQAAHTAGIVHRDLKPDNVFLIPDPEVHGGERVKVLDFGVAKLIEPMDGDGVNTHSQMMLGTPKYMSPEQARSAAKVDHRADIYTLGCMLFEMLAGRGPFTGDAGEQIIAHQKQAPPSVRDLVPSVPSTIEGLIRRMLAKSPDDRPQSMRDVVDALTESSDEPDTVVRTPLPVARLSAEITTVEDKATTRREYTNEQKTLFIAIGLAAVLVVGVVVFLIMKSDEPAAPAKVVTPTPPIIVEPSADAAVVLEATPDAAVIEAPADDMATLRLQCKLAADAKRWSDLIDCAMKLMDGGDPEGRDLYTTGHEEEKAQRASEHLTAAIRNGDAGKAKSHLDAIGKDSVYRKDAEIAFAALRSEKIADDPVRKNDKVCQAEELFGRGMDIFSKNGSGFGLAQFEASHKCQPSTNTAKFILAASCKSKNLEKARVAWKRLPASVRQQMESLCAANGFFGEMLSR
jgi:tRNA A-37 threonylcarbamoyl transferase component Bud32